MQLQLCIFLFLTYQNVFWNIAHTHTLTVAQQSSKLRIHSSELFTNSNRKEEEENNNNNSSSKYIQINKIKKHNA